MRPQSKALLRCRICRVDYERRLGRLTKEVDVYCAWIDEAEKLNEQQRLGLADQAEGLGFSSQAPAGSGEP